MQLFQVLSRLPDECSALMALSRMLGIRHLVATRNNGENSPSIDVKTL